MNDLNTVEIEDFILGIYADVPEVMRELFHRLPIGQEFTLANGRKFEFVKFYEPKEKEGQWTFGVDARFKDGCGADHLEFCLFHTGGGGNVL